MAVGTILGQCHFCFLLEWTSRYPKASFPLEIDEIMMEMTFPFWDLEQQSCQSGRRGGPVIVAAFQGEKCFCRSCDL